VTPPHPGTTDPPSVKRTLPVGGTSDKTLAVTTTAARPPATDLLAPSTTVLGAGFTDRAIPWPAPEGLPSDPAIDDAASRGEVARPAVAWCGASRATGPSDGTDAAASGSTTAVMPITTAAIVRKVDTAPPLRGRRAFDGTSWISIWHSFLSTTLSSSRRTPTERHATYLGDRFGSPAGSESPVTLRPLLAEGLPVRRCPRTAHQCIGYHRPRRSALGRIGLARLDCPASWVPA